MILYSKDIQKARSFSRQALRRIIVQMVDPSVIDRLEGRGSRASRMTQAFRGRSTKRFRSMSSDSSGARSLLEAIQT